MTINPKPLRDWTPEDYAAEARRTRIAQGLPPDVPQELLDAVAALLPPEH